MATLSRFEKIKSQVGGLAHTGNTCSLRNDQHRKKMKAQVNDLYRSYLFVKSDYQAGKVSKENYRTMLRALIALVDKDYLSSVPEIEWMLCGDWAKVK